MADKAVDRYKAALPPEVCRHSSKAHNHDIQRAIIRWFPAWKRTGSVCSSTRLADFFDAMTARLAEHNADLPDAERARREIRVRAVHHAGDVIVDENGACGEALDAACRLLDAPRLKRCLRERAAPLVLAVSGDIHSSVVRHEYPGISRAEFGLLFRVRVGGALHQAWVRRAAAAEPDGAAARCDEAHRPPAPSR